MVPVEEVVVGVVLIVGVCDLGSVCSFCCLCRSVKRFRLTRRSWVMRWARGVDVLFEVVAVVEFELVELEVGLVVGGGCSCGCRLLVKRPFWNTWA